MRERQIERLDLMASFSTDAGNPTGCVERAALLEFPPPEDGPDADARFSVVIDAGFPGAATWFFLEQPGLPVSAIYTLVAGRRDPDINAFREIEFGYSTLMSLGSESLKEIQSRASKGLTRVPETKDEAEPQNVPLDEINRALRGATAKLPRLEMEDGTPVDELPFLDGIATAFIVALYHIRRYSPVTRGRANPRYGSDRRRRRWR